MTPKRKLEKGFTLMEVLVAMSVLAIALAAIIQSVSTNSSHAGYLREKTLAHWVAMNRIAEIQSMNEYPATGTKRGSEEMAGHEWHWQTTVVDSGVENVRRIEVEVRSNKDDKSSLSFLIGLIGKPNT
jgi:general secretion pathway protein I